MAPGLTLPYGYKDARWALLTTAFIGEFIQGMPCRAAVVLMPDKATQALVAGSPAPPALQVASCLAGMLCRSC